MCEAEPREPEWTEMEEHMRVSLNEAIIGEKSAAQALNELQKKFEEILGY